MNSTDSYHPIATGNETNSNPPRFNDSFQDPEMEVLYHIRQYFLGIFPYIGLIYGRYLQFRFLKWPLIHLCVLLGFRSHVFDHRHRGEPRATDDGATGLDANGDEDLFGTKGDQPL